MGDLFAYEALWRGKMRVQVLRTDGRWDVVIRTPEGRELVVPADSVRRLDVPPSDQHPGIVRK